MPQFPLQNMQILILCFLALLRLCSSDDEYLPYICPNTTTFTPNSTFQNNRNQLLSNLVSNATLDTGFYQTTAGGRNSTDTVEGLFLCRGDVSADACKDWVDTAASDVVQLCPIEKTVVIWYDECMVRYSNQSFLSTESPGLFMWNTANLSQIEEPQFNQVLGKISERLLQRVINATEKSATQEADVTGLIKLYTLGQCTPDLSTVDCSMCLTDAIAELPDCCGGKEGGRVMYPSCNIRFEIYPFYELKTAAPPPSPLSTAHPPPSPIEPPPPALVVEGRSKLPLIVISSILAPLAFCVLVVVVARCFIPKLKL